MKQDTKYNASFKWRRCCNIFKITAYERNLFDLIQNMSIINDFIHSQNTTQEIPLNLFIENEDDIP